MRSRCMHVSKDCRVGCPGRTIISGGREGADVGEAREVMDRVTDAILRGDLEALKGGFTLRTRSLRRPTRARSPGATTSPPTWPSSAQRFRSLHGRSGPSTRAATRQSTKEPSLGEYRLHDGAEPRNHSRNRQE